MVGLDSNRTRLDSLVLERLGSIFQRFPWNSSSISVLRSLSVMMWEGYPCSVVVGQSAGTSNEFATNGSRLLMRITTASQYWLDLVFSTTTKSLFPARGSDVAVLALNVLDGYFYATEKVHSNSLSVYLKSIDWIDLKQYISQTEKINRRKSKFKAIAISLPATMKIRRGLSVKPKGFRCTGPTWCFCRVFVFFGWWSYSGFARTFGFFSMRSFVEAKDIAQNDWDG